MKCNRCGKTKIRVRKNYTHGKRSKATISRSCMACGSTDIETPETNPRWGRNRRR